MEFIGRSEQLALLDEAVQFAHTGDPQFVVFSGEAGVGKTRLMEHFADRLAESGTRVLRGACIELGTEGLALAPVRAMLRDLIRQVGRDSVAELLPSGAGLTRLLPELGEPDPGDHGSQARLFELFAALLERLGTERAVLLVIDDLHWADRSTRELLGFLARSLRGARVLAVLAYRAEDLDRRHPLPGFLAELERLPRVRRVELPRFGRAETAELLAQVVAGQPSPALVDGVFRRARGNAYFTAELADADPQPGTLPDSLRDLLLRRVERLPEPARRLVGLAAVGGRYVPHDLLAATAATPEEELFEGLRAAADAQVLVPDADGYAFPHALLREAVLDDLLPAQRRRLHRSFAEVLEARPELVPADRRPAELAHHYYGAGEPGKALPALLSAAEAAERIYAHAEQAQLLSRALEITDADRAAADRAAIFAKATVAAGWAGETIQALDLIDRALAETDQARAPERAAMLLAQRGMALHNLMRGGVLTAASEAEALLSGVGLTERAPVLDLIGALYQVSGDWERTRATAEDTVRVAEDCGNADVATNARTTLGTALVRLGLYDDGLATLHAARDHADRRGDVMRLTRVQINLANAQASLGRHAEAVDAARVGLEASRKAGLARSLGAICAVSLATSLTALGRLEEAETVSAQTLGLDPVSGFAAVLHALRGEVALARGEVDAAREHCSLAGTLLGRGPGDSLYRLPVVHLETELALADNRLEEAGSTIAEALPMASEPGEAANAWPVLTTGARVATAARAAGAVPGLSGQLRDAAAKLPVDTPLWSAHAAQFAAEMGEEPWAEAVAGWDAVGEPYRAAYARLRAAEAAARDGNRGAVPGLLRAAAEAAKQLGAQRLLREVESLARGAHVMLETQAPKDADPLERTGLTDREGEVLRLIAAGHSNRQIGGELFISAKTVSVHVSRILGKLGVATRGEAAATAHRMRLFDNE